MYIINVLYFCIGLILGSFINVVIYRIPKDLSIIKPRSFCPNCKSSIPFYRNIPIITYLFQLGQCHNCKNNISIIYPLVELLVGLIWLFSAIYFQNLNNILIFSIISTVLVAISIIDLKHYIIPIELSIFALIVITFNLIMTNTFMNHLSGLIIGTGYLSIVFLFTWLLTKKQALGLGDIQLIFVLGYWIGDIRILLVIFISATFALLAWALISIIYGYKKDRKLPFGTYLSIVSIIIYPIEFNILSYLL